MTKRRAGISPLVLEAILFLSENKDLWNILDVAAANKKRLANNAETRAKKKIEENAAIAALAGLANIDINN
eukprot:CAMPEP_0197715318 /NCGR_PEP_ID=MMETSP1434-20131217/513_1 /TAXON_ID=265543 /ORGANISM="Minutocellus polymorphus, Strain CCMP3303" /LENGTH=70 /DNA_ID=CAMNT_0043299397 /DNA_START=337 /DNA_END=549 /DNA_ORIENTATION=+